MDVPEIRAIVAQFMRHDGLAAAALVCKSWNVTFTPALYSRIYMHCYKGADKEGFIANADFICHLELTEDEVHLFSRICTKIGSLCIKTLSSWSPPNLNQLSTLVRRNSSIRSINIGHGCAMSCKELLPAVSSCSDLRNLDISGFILDSVCMGFIFDIAIHLDTLRIHCLVTFPESLDKWPCFPSMKEVYLDEAIPAQSYLEVIRRCPELRVLRWHIKQDDPCPVSHISSVFKLYCPSVKQLTLEAAHLMDENIAEILNGCHRLVSVHLPGSKFGELAFLSLSRHFTTLRGLNLERCAGLTSTMVQQIMTSCRRLTDLTATTLDAIDILGDTNEEESIRTGTGIRDQSQEWVCVDLDSLGVFICGLEGKPIEWHQKVMQRLAKLTKLTSLSVGPKLYSYSSSTGTRDGLDLRVKTGLDALSSLKRLECLFFDGLWQQMEEQDMRWMIEAWPEFFFLHGRMHSDPRQRWKMNQVLKERNICTSIFDDDFLSEPMDEPERRRG